MVFVPLLGKTSSPQKVSSSTYVPESPPSAAVPGPSYRNYSCEFFLSNTLYMNHGNIR